MINTTQFSYWISSVKNFIFKSLLAYSAAYRVINLSHVACKDI